MIWDYELTETLSDVTASAHCSFIVVVVVVVVETSVVQRWCGGLCHCHTTLSFTIGHSDHCGRDNNNDCRHDYRNRYFSSNQQSYDVCLQWFVPHARLMTFCTCVCVVGLSRLRLYGLPVVCIVISVRCVDSLVTHVPCWSLYVGLQGLLSCCSSRQLVDII